MGRWKNWIKCGNNECGMIKCHLWVRMIHPRKSPGLYGPPREKSRIIQSPWDNLRGNKYNTLWKQENSISFKSRGDHRIQSSYFHCQNRFWLVKLKKSCWIALKKIENHWHCYPAIGRSLDDLERSWSVLGIIPEWQLCSKIQRGTLKLVFEHTGWWLVQGLWKNRMVIPLGMGNPSQPADIMEQLRVCEHCSNDSWGGW